MSLEADAQSTTDETKSCSSSSLEEIVNLVERIASVQQEIKEELAGNSSLLKEVAKEVKRIASNQEEIAKQMNASKSCECEAAKPSKQALVSALVSEFVLYFTHSAHITSLRQWPV